MASRPPRLENAEMRTSTLTNVHEGDDPQLQVFLFPNGEMILQAEIGELIHLKPEQVVQLHQFFEGDRVQARMLDMLRKSLYHSSDAGRKFVQAFDRMVRKDTRRGNAPTA